MFKNYPVFNYVFITLLFEETTLEPSLIVSLSNDSVVESSFLHDKSLLRLIIYQGFVFITHFLEHFMYTFVQSFNGGRKRGKLWSVYNKLNMTSTKNVFTKIRMSARSHFVSFGLPKIISTEVAYSLKFNLLLVWLNYLSCEADICFKENRFCLFSSV